MGSTFTTEKPGLQTCVQELPGRIGFLEQGFPFSGPFDAWSFRQANLLVGNSRDTAALECQYVGPSLRIDSDCRVAVTGANMQPKLDGEPIELWQTVHVKAGQLLELGAAITGVRAYIAFSGGIVTEPVLGSRAVFHQAGVGGRALVPGQTLPLGEASADDRTYTIPIDKRLKFSQDKCWNIEALKGPNDDWLDDESVEMFFSTDWKIQAKSSRTGVRLTGPEFSFSERALNKNSDHGQDPSNIIDHGYPFGAINLAGHTPIILVHDSPSTGGFINPFTVASAALWKVGQAKPNESIRFRCIDQKEAGELRSLVDQSCQAEVLKVV